LSMEQTDGAATHIVPTQIAPMRQRSIEFLPI
jgi:hypothetical protein